MCRASNKIVWLFEMQKQIRKAKIETKKAMAAYNTLLMFNRSDGCHRKSTQYWAVFEKSSKLYPTINNVIKNKRWVSKFLMVKLICV